jgi:hypothetical protein
MGLPFSTVRGDNRNWTEWLTENGSIAMLNNGIEFGTTYSIMLLVSLFIDGGLYINVDHLDSIS